MTDDGKPFLEITPRIMDELAEMASEMGRDRAAFLEDALAGLLAAGVKKDEIELQEWPGVRTVIVVRGTPRYLWTMGNGGVVL